MVIYLRERLLLPCMAMAQTRDAPLGSSDMSSSPSTGPELRCAPTALYPPPRYNLRTNFKSLQSVATIIVGSATSKSHPQTTYTIHRDLLTEASPFFAAALKGTFAEGLDQVVRMPEEKPEIFEWFIWWLYTGSLTSPSSHGCTQEPQRASINSLALYANNLNHHIASSLAHITHNDGDLRNAAGSPKYFLLLDLYSLSDRLLTTALSNHILDTMARLSESTNSVPTPSDTWILYDGIRDSAPMRRLVLDLFAYKKTDKLLESHKDEWHPRFLRELVVKLKRPGADCLDRHSLVPWRPTSWPATKACESCRELLKPSSSASGEKCDVCDRAFCVVCVRNCGGSANRMVVGGGGGGGGGGGEIGACKPWLKGMCNRYHEHIKGEGQAQGQSQSQRHDSVRE